jgi:hypothetical protein
MENATIDGLADASLTIRDISCRINPMKKYEKILEIAQLVADKRPYFFEIKGAGLGDKDTDSYMGELRKRIENTVGKGLSERSICGDNNLKVDFYVQDEATIVEVALSLRNSNSEFERDIFKAFLAQSLGNEVERLVFLSKPGALKRHEQPSSKAIVDWVKKEYGISIEIRELS